MRKPRILPSLVLMAVLAAACAPAESTVAPAQPVVVEPSATVAATLDASDQPTAAPVESLEPAPLAVATSRGPDLHATDPATVSLASGGLQLVEFFRFT
jgi:hypothetical protein